MNWEAIGAIGEVGGMLAVVISLIYLGSQLRQNTRALHTSSYQHHADQMGRLNASAVENADFAEIFTRAMADADSLNSVERFRVYSHLLNMFHAIETLYRGAQSGAIPMDLWEAERRALRGVLQTSVVLSWWQTILQEGPFTAEFRDEIERLRSEPAQTEEPGTFLKMEIS